MSTGFKPFTTVSWIPCSVLFWFLLVELFFQPLVAGLLMRFWSAKHKCKVLLSHPSGLVFCLAGWIVPPVCCRVDRCPLCFRFRLFVICCVYLYPSAYVLMVVFALACCCCCCTFCFHNTRHKTCFLLSCFFSPIFRPACAVCCWLCWVLGFLQWLLQALCFLAEVLPAPLRCRLVFVPFFSWRGLFCCLLLLLAGGPLWPPLCLLQVLCALGALLSWGRVAFFCCLCCQRSYGMMTALTWTW